MAINFNPQPLSPNERAKRVSDAIARGVYAKAEQDARVAARDDPEWGGTPNDPYSYDSPLANRMPAASSVTSDTLIGMANVWIVERENLYNSVPITEAPFTVGVVPPGLNYALTQQDVDALNQHYGITP